MIKKRAMVGWYDPAMLVKTGIRVAISTIFGHFADKREALALANFIDPQKLDPQLDYAEKSEDGEFWFDFVADTGDGWNPTYAIARLLAEATITPDGSADAIPRGKLLIMGGDEVYPTASRKEYEERLFAAYDRAYHPPDVEAAWDNDHKPDLFAVPGNHDWYDGLNSFSSLFCRRRIAPPKSIGLARPGRIIGGRQTKQTRSYFAIRLPGNWWLWGTDSQLEGYIDQPQIEFFQYVAKNWMAPGSQLILCVGQPSWEYVDTQNPAKAFEHFSYLERLAGAATDVKGKPLGHKLKLILSGDAHHYARYTEADRHYVTCGGGGAFLHPTHHLESKVFQWDYPEPGISVDPDSDSYPRALKIAAKGADKALYPKPTTSRWLTLWNLLFAFKNWKFPVMLLFPFYLLLIWLLDMNSQSAHQRSLGDLLTGSSVGDAISIIAQLVVASPMPIIMVAAAFAGFRYFSDIENRAGRLLAGGVHTAAHGVAVAATLCFTFTCGSQWWGRDASGFLPLAVAGATAAFASATVLGLYLWVNLAIFKRHWNEAFSSIAHQGYKSFLRFRISTDGTLTLYPVGLTKVPNDRNGLSQNKALRPHLIEELIFIDP